MRHPEEAAEFGARARRFLPATLADLLPTLLAARSGQRGAQSAERKTGERGGRRAKRKKEPEPPSSAPRAPRSTPVIPVHRLDKETSGLVVFARTPAAARHLGAQFRAHSTERLYLALVRGRAHSRRIESSLVADRGDGRRGSGKPGEGQRAVTHVRVVEQLGDYTLVECRLETGRTHQVRIHLGETSTPLCGERIYDRPLNGRPLPDGSGARRPMLHAAVLGFLHPVTGKPMRWESRLPEDMRELQNRLRFRRDQSEEK